MTLGLSKREPQERRTDALIIQDVGVEIGNVEFDIMSLIARIFGEELRNDLEGYKRGRWGGFGDYYGEHCWSAFEIGFVILKNTKKGDGI